MKFKNSGEDEAHLAEINIIPLVDIMLVLLIIFMVAAPMLDKSGDIKVDPPKANTARSDSKSDDVVLQVDQSGAIYINGDSKQKYALVSIEERLVEMFENNPKKVIYIEADQGIKYGYLVELMALCQKAGIEKIGLKTKPEDLAVR